MTMVWAHRGASGYAPENTLPAFEMALEQGADGIELDVHLSRDDAVVVIHDETLERTTDGTGWVADRSLDDLKAMDASFGREGFAGTRIPTLDEVLALVADAGVAVNIELKNDRMPYKGLEARVLEIVAAAGVGDRVVFSSFNHYSLKKLAELGATQPLGVLYSDALYRPWRYVATVRAQAIHPHFKRVSPKLVRRSHDLGLAVNTWTVNEPADLARLAGWGVDAVITNLPDVARSVLG